jgi:hypothetical protein
MLGSCTPTNPDLIIAQLLIREDSDGSKLKQQDPSGDVFCEAGQTINLQDASLHLRAAAPNLR